MRILHTSDWHLGRSLEQVSRIEEQKDFIDFLCLKSEDEQIDLILIAGDIYDTYNPSAAAEEIFYDGLERLSNGGKRAIVVIAGNHDNPERLCASSPLAYKNGIVLLGYPGSIAKVGESRDGQVRVIDAGPGWLELSVEKCSHNAVILTLPYPSESRLEELLSEQAEETALQKAYSQRISEIINGLSHRFREDTVNLIVSHLFMLGGKESDSERTLQVGGAMTVDPYIFPKNAHYAALGHLHRPQEVRNASCPAYYCGSPLAYSFSESSYAKLVYIIDAVPGKAAEIRPLYLDCGKPLRKWLAAEGISQAFQWCEEDKDAGAWVDLEIVTDRVLTVEEQKKLRNMHRGIINIRPRFRTEEVELEISLSREGRKIDELFRDYYRYRNGMEITDDLMGAFVEILNEEAEEDSAFPVGGGAGDAS